jgi:predicted dehydrogenase
MNLGIIGMGWGRRVQIPAFDKVEELDVTAICCRNKSKLEKIAEEFKIPILSTNWKDIINNKNIDAVSIVTPNYLHNPISLAAAEKGKHVLCEKPLSLNYGQALEMYESFLDTNLGNMVTFPYRYIPSIIKTKKLLDKKEIGKLFHINFNFFVKKNLKRKNDWHCDRNLSGTDALGNIGSHLIDLGTYLIGDFESVCGQMGSYTRETDDVCNFIAYHKEGILGSYCISKVASARKSSMQLSFNGSNGSLICDVEVDKDDKIRYSLKLGKPLDDRLELIEEGIITGSNLYQEVGKNFLKQCSLEDYDGTTFYDGLVTQKVIDSLLESVNSKMWVNLF